MTEDEYKELTTALASLKQQMAEAAGARKEIIKQLKAEHGVSGPKGAKRKLEELAEKKADLDRRIDIVYRKLKKQYGKHMKKLEEQE